MHIRLLALCAAVLLCACAPSGTAQLAQDAESTSVKPGSSTAAGSISTSKTAGEKVDEPAAAPSASSAIPVEIYPVRGRAVEDAISTTGQLRANEQVDLRSEVGGRIVGLHFEEGQTVRSGDLLVKINDADLVAEQRRLKVQREMAKRREARSKTLLDEGTLSQEVYEEARASLLVLEAQLDQIEAEIAKTEIRAPFAGTVGLRQISEGSYITSSTTIAHLQSLDPIKLDFAVPEKYAGEIGPGDIVTFSVSSGEQTVQGKVYAVEPRIDAATRTVQVRARAANPGQRLFPGAFAKVRLVLDEQSGALMIPSIALIPGAEGTTVYVEVDGKASPRPVTVGRRTEDRVQVLTGLQEGDRVIISGIQQMRPGVEVNGRDRNPVRDRELARDGDPSQ